MSEPRTESRARAFAGHLRGALLVALVIVPFRSAAADWSYVPTGSMDPTILPGDRILVDKLAYDLRVPLTSWRLASFGAPARGDVVVVLSPVDGTRLVKRVGAVAGDLVEVRDGRLRIDGRPARYEALAPEVAAALAAADGAASTRPRVFAREVVAGRAHLVAFTPSTPSLRDMPPTRVPPDHVLLLGDNRDRSLDSRAYGFAPRELILGRATRVLYSLDPDAVLSPRGERWLLPIE